MVRLERIKLCLLGSLVGAVSASSAQALPATFDPRAKDAVDVFAMRCLATHGDRTQADRDFGTGTSGAKRAPDSTMFVLEGGYPIGEGSIFRTPNAALVMLEYNPGGLCSVRIVEADESSIQMAIRDLARASAVVAKSALATSAPTVRTENGATITYQDYSYHTDGHIARMSLTTSDHSIAVQQHVLTLSYSKPKV